MCNFVSCTAVIINALNGHHPNFIEKEIAEAGVEEGSVLPPKAVRDRYISGIDMISVMLSMCVCKR